MSDEELLNARDREPSQ